MKSVTKMKVKTKVIITIALAAALVLCSAAVIFAGCPDKGIGKLYITSENPVDKGRAWIEASPDKSNKAGGSIKLYDSEGNKVFEGEMSQIKGRGNSTWLGEKKPYQIKLEEKADLLSTGNEANRNKTWVLLANYYDHSNMRNTLVFDLAEAIGMDFPVEHRMVNLFYDGEYRGLYMLCEKVMVSEGRVAIYDLEAENEAVNPDIALDELEVKTGRTENGAVYHYCYGMETPENYSGGYLLEMDYSDRAAEEISYFTTRRGNSITVKSPECCSLKEMEYIASYYQDFEDALYEGEKSEKNLSDFINLETAAQCYIINEFTKNNDGFISSAYLYLDKDAPVMKMGPVWDYDSTLGLALNYDHMRTGSPKDLYTGTYGVGEQLLKNVEFRNLVRNIYLNTVYPLINNILLGHMNAVSGDGSLRSLAFYKKELSLDAASDGRVWNYTDFDEACEVLRSFAAERNQWLYAEISRWNDDGTKSFDDVPPGAWYCESVGKAYRSGIMSGVSTARFNPGGIMTRAQVAQVLYNLGDRKNEGFAAIFSDIDRNHWAYKAVNWAVGKGIVTGYANGTFKPDNFISRQDLVTMLYRNEGRPEVEMNTLYNYNDGLAVKDYAQSAMQWAINTGLITGYEDGTIRPAVGASRAEAAAILLRYMQ